jgi:hypothetical protein
MIGTLTEATFSALLILYRLIQDTAWLESVQKEAPTVLLQALRVGIKVGSTGDTHCIAWENYCSG